jgi:hypothetical protein
LFKVRKKQGKLGAIFNGSDLSFCNMLYHYLKKNKRKHLYISLGYGDCKTSLFHRVRINCGGGRVERKIMV